MGFWKRLYCNIFGHVWLPRLRGPLAPYGPEDCETCGATRELPLVVGPLEPPPKLHLIRYGVDGMDEKGKDEQPEKSEPRPVAEGLAEHDKIVKETTKKQMRPCPRCKQPTWQDGLCLKCRTEDLEEQNSAQAGAISDARTIAEAALVLAGRSNGIHIEPSIPHVLNRLRANFIALVKHLAWCSYQIAAGQPYNWPATAEQIESQIDAVLYLDKYPNATARDNHDNWMRARQAQGWKYGPVKDERARTHPDLMPYDQLPEVERLKDDMDLLAYKVAVHLWDAYGSRRATYGEIPSARVMLKHHEAIVEAMAVAGTKALEADLVCKGRYRVGANCVHPLRGNAHCVDVIACDSCPLLDPDIPQAVYPCLPCGGKHLEETEHNKDLCGHPAAPANSFCKDLLDIENEAGGECPVELAQMEEMGKKPDRWKDLPCKGEFANEHPTLVGHYDGCHHPANTDGLPCQPLQKSDSCPVELAQEAQLEKHQDLAAEAAMAQEDEERLREDGELDAEEDRL